MLIARVILEQRSYNPSDHEYKSHSLFVTLVVLREKIGGGGVGWGWVRM